MWLRSHSPVFDADATRGDDPVGPLPKWDLSDLYSAPDAPELNRDLEWLISETEAFARDYKGKLSGLSSSDFETLMERMEEIQIATGRIMSYAGLRYYQETTDPARAAFLSNMQEKVTEASARMVFFSLEFNRVSDGRLDELVGESQGLSRYRPYFERIRAMKSHQLSDELEQFLHDQSVVGASAWNRLFDETLAGMEFEVNGHTLGLEATLNLLSDSAHEQREAGYAALARSFSQKLPLFARITNTLIKEKEIEDRWRKLPTPQSARHLANHVEPEVVAALTTAVKAAYPSISHRYYRLKARWLGQEHLNIWDRNAPLPVNEDAIHRWQDAEQIVLDAYAGFHPDMAEQAGKFFSNGWIDAGVTAGKAPGAFSHPCVTTVHPYILLNFMGKTRDVMTLAHELGHGVHQLLAADQGEILSSTPLTLAETASVFGEMLTFRKLIDEAEDVDSKKMLLAGKTEDMINTVVRQIAFYDFECRLHETRRNGELKPEEINEIWMTVQRESLGDAFVYPDDYGTFWAYIPHFIHSPFYVYAYAFGDGLVNALYAAYRSDLPNFEEMYFDLLRAGGSKHHSELLAPFGLDASDPTFWNKGLELISSMIDELETM